MLRLSVLDQSPVSSGSSATVALRETVALAEAAERLGYSRYWLAEHHGSPGLAGTAPEVLVARVAAATSSIRVGAGGVLLSHYSPLKVAESFRVLAGLFPGRIDLGIGRADGASTTTASALRDGPSETFGKKLGELQAHLSGSDSDVLAMPEGVDGPDVWLLSSSSDGVAGAAGLGLPLCFAHFISPRFGAQLIARYRSSFRSGPGAPGSTVAAAVAVICADTDDEAELLMSSVDVWRLASEEGRGPVPSVKEARSRPCTQLERATIIQNRKGVVLGSPARVAAELRQLADELGADELFVLTVCHDPAARLRSYELLADALLPTAR